MTSTSTAPTTDALLPEVLTTIGSYLDPPSLFSCLQVNTTWYHALLPLLWESIDDSLYSWPAILKQSDFRNEASWLQALFNKHGHLIRHLTIHWTLTLDAVGSSNTCTLLSSLSLRNTRDDLSDEEEEQQDETLGPEEMGRRKQERTLPLPDEYLLSPAFSEALRPSLDYHTSDKQHRQNWMSGQRFWVLINNNPGLQRLALGRCLETLCRVHSAAFLTDTFIGLCNLTTLENDLYSESLEVILTRNPALTNFRSKLAFTKATLSTTFLSMRSLVTSMNLASRDFFLLLRHLPNLHSLQCGAIGLFDRTFCPDAAEILEGKPSNLQRFSFHTYIRTDTAIATHVFRWLPHLQELICKNQLYPATANSLVVHCPDLEVLRQEGGNDPIYCFQSEREQRNFFLPLLQTCTKLRVFDAIHHRIDADLLVEKPLACTQLEIFRCQVVGVTRPLEMEEVVVSEVPPEATLPSQEMDKALLEQQRNVFDQLARLRQLSTIDLGYIWRNTSRNMEGALPHYYGEDGEEYIDYGGPIPQTLELTLESGLDRLSVLGNLEVFGFEGVDFKLGKPELEWMAIHWPRLRILRGLHKDTSLVKLEPEKHKNELREYMQVLRPDVLHTMR
ncbi:hypothetical protein EC991_001149 [Linnemannia zychae]|nr:hypothetical protein EC991_001149 [Linnemannia zychae]